MNSNGRLPSHHCRVFAALLALWFAASGASEAQAGDGKRRLRIGTGIVGLQILKRLTTDPDDERAKSHERPRAKKTVRKPSKARLAKQANRSSSKARVAKARDSGKTAPPAVEPVARADPSANAVSPHAAPSSDPATEPNGMPANALPSASPPPAANLSPVREALRKMGYGTDLEAGSDGVRLREAVMAFQRDIGGAPTGTLTVDQLRVLYMRHAAMKAAIDAAQGEK